MKFCPTCKSKFPTDINYCPNDATKLLNDPEVGPSQSIIGMILDNRYRIMSKLGEGGMGSVYAAEHILLKKNVAIKVLRYDLARKEDVVRRFQNEAIAASRIGHENIIEVTDFGRTPDGSVYFVMEHLNGSALADIIHKSGFIPLKRAIPILLQITKALSAAHSQGIIHRDLKPENIVLIDKADRKDFVKILDFGISKMLDTSDRAEKLTAMGMIVGTPEYMSPEQAAGMSVDKRTDIYSLGVIMYEMMTGRLPFLADNAIRILMMHQTEKPARPRDINPEIHIGIEQIILKCMEKKPEDRFQDMSEVSQALIQILSATSKPQEPKKTIAFNPQAISIAQDNDISTVQQMANASVAPPPRSTVQYNSREMPSIPVKEDAVSSDNINPVMDIGVKAIQSGTGETISPEIQQSNITPVTDLNSDNQSVQSVIAPDTSGSTGIDSDLPAAVEDKSTNIDQAQQIIGERSETEEEGVEKRVSGKKSVIFIIAFALLIVIGGAIYFLLGQKKSTDIVPQTKPVENKSEQVSVTEVKKKEPEEEVVQENVVANNLKEQAEKEGIDSQKKDIKVAKVSNSVVLDILSDPENVEIYKGGVMLGVTPYKIKGKKNSSGEYIFKKAGYEPLKKRIVLTSSGEMRVNLRKIEEKKMTPKKGKDPFEKIDDLKDLSF